MDTFAVHDRRCFLFARGTYFAAEKSHLFCEDHALQNITRVSNPKLHKQYGREVRQIDAVVWKNEKI